MILEPGIKPIDFLRERRTRLGAEHQADLANRLRHIARLIERDELAAGTAQALVLVVLTDDMPTGTYAGMVSWDDFHETRDVLTDIISYAKGGGQTGTFDEYLAERSKTRRVAKAYYEAEQERKDAETQWGCEHCAMRFKTERGAVQHERRCYKNPNAAQYLSGRRKPITAANGTIVGFES